MKSTLAMITLFLSNLLFPRGKVFLKEELCFGDLSVYSAQSGGTLFHSIPNSSYFSNLLNNLGNNQTSSTCGYVALAMLLSYYDNVLNDAIVADKYEVAGINGESPGTLHEPNNSALTFSPDSVSSYYKFIRKYKNSSLHSYLILKDKGALNFNPPVNYMSQTYKEEFGTTQFTLADLAHDYLIERGINQYCSIKCLSSTSPNYTMNDIVDEIRYEINQGRPVVCGFGKHARIVYGCSTGISTHFRCHTGYIYHSDVDITAPYDGCPSSYATNIGFVSLIFNFN